MPKHVVKDVAYAIRTITEFLDGTGGERDWDIFTSISLKSHEVDSIRKRALLIDLPVDDQGEEELKELIEELRLMCRE